MSDTPINYMISVPASYPDFIMKIENTLADLDHTTRQSQMWHDYIIPYNKYESK